MLKTKRYLRKNVPKNLRSSFALPPPILRSEGEGWEMLKRSHEGSSAKLRLSLIEDLKI